MSASESRHWPGGTPGGRLKMRDLERTTGVGREAIRFYIREGLLPEPERPARNVAWYDQSYVGRIRLIKELQEKRYLPLHVIRRIVADDGGPSGAEIEAVLDLDGKVFSSASVADERLEDAARRLDVPPQQVRVIASKGAVTVFERDGEEWLDGPSVEILDLWSRTRRAGFRPEQGFPPEQVGLYVDAVEWLAREELRLFSRGVTGRVGGDEAVRMAEAGIDLIGRLITLLRKKTLLRLISEGNVPADAARPTRRRPKRRIARNAGESGAPS